MQCNVARNVSLLSYYFNSKLVLLVVVIAVVLVLLFIIHLFLSGSSGSIDEQ